MEQIIARFFAFLAVGAGGGVYGWTENVWWALGTCFGTIIVLVLAHEFFRDRAASRPARSPAGREGGVAP